MAGPNSIQFIDECSIFVRGGDGGDGCAAFRREPGRPRGGPAGGDGGGGGSVILIADPQRSTFRFDVPARIPCRASQAGQGRDRYGRGGEDLIVEVPAGVVVKDSDGNVLCDLATPGQRFVARGGQGGRGNIHFATSTWQAPEFAEPGTPGEERTLKLELKLLADVGLLWLSQRRQIVADCTGVAGPAQNRQLSVYDADAESWCGVAAAR